MAQKKKKKKMTAVQKARKSGNVQIGEKHTLIRKKTNGDFDIDWTLAYPNMKLNNMLNLYTQDIRQSAAYKSVQKMYYHPSSDTDTAIIRHKEYAEKTARLKIKLEKQFNIWFSNYTDATDPFLNKYNTDSEKNTPVDSLDLREYMNSDMDLLQQAFREIQTNPDIAMLWSTQELITIRMTDTLYYRVQRVGYDHINNAVRYCFYEYLTLQLSDTETIEIPSMQEVITIDIGRIKNLEYMYPLNPNGKSVSMEPYKRSNGENLQKTILSDMTDDVTNPDDFYALRIGIMGADCMLSTNTHMQLHHSQWSKPEYRNLRDRLHEFCTDLYGNPLLSEKQAVHTIMSASAVIAAIIVANSYLKKNSVSRPVNKNLKYETEIILQNQPERKTRILGKNIMLTSAKKPQTPDMEKIIRYHTPEWTRRSHLRHLKSGKVIEIPAGKCQRKCVDMTNIKSNIPQQSVDYIIRPETESENKQDGTNI